jgi:hypothetical protein
MRIIWKQRADQHIRPVDRSLSSTEQIARGTPGVAGRGHDAIDLADADPGAVVGLQTPGAGRRRKAVREIAARDRERADDVVVRDPGGQLGHR